MTFEDQLAYDLFVAMSTKAPLPPPDDSGVLMEYIAQAREAARSCRALAHIVAPELKGQRP